MTQIIGTPPINCRTLYQAGMSLDPSEQNITNLTFHLLEAETSMTCKEEQDSLCFDWFKMQEAV